MSSNTTSHLFYRYYPVYRDGHIGNGYGSVSTIAQLNLVLDGLARTQSARREGIVDLHIVTVVEEIDPNWWQEQGVAEATLNAQRSTGLRPKSVSYQIEGLTPTGRWQYQGQTTNKHVAYQSAKNVALSGSFRQTRVRPIYAYA